MLDEGERFSMKTVSVIVAIYNIEEYLQRCVDSLANQTLKDLEIILVDDCSSDSSGALCDKLERIFPNKIKVIHKKKNEGLAEARNTGIQAATGKYIAFVDGDDYVEENTYETLFQIAELNSADSVIFGYYHDTENGMTEHRKDMVAGVYEGKKVMEKAFPEIIGTLPGDNTDYAIGYAPWAQLLRRDALIDNHVRFTSERKLIYEDLMFALDFYPEAKKIVVIQDAFYHYCENAGSLTMSVKADRYDRIKQMYEHLKKTQQYNKLLFTDDKIWLRFRRTMLSYIRLCIMQLSSDKKYRKKIEYIIEDDFCREIIDGYPVFLLPPKQAVFAVCLRYKMKGILCWVTSHYMRMK